MHRNLAVFWTVAGLLIAFCIAGCESQSRFSYSFDDPDACTVCPDSGKTSEPTSDAGTDATSDAISDTGGGATPDVVSNASNCADVVCEAGEICDPTTGMCGACSADSQEPNNDRDSAKTLTTDGLQDLTICPGEEDFFKLTIDEDNTALYIEIAFTHSNAQDLDAEFLDSMGNTLSIRTTGNDDEIIFFFQDDTSGNFPKLAAGEYFVRVFGSNEESSNSYDINVNVNPSFSICLSDSDCTTPESCNETSFICQTQSCTTNLDCLRDEQRCTNGTCVVCEGDSLEANDSRDTARSLVGNLEPDVELNTCNGDDFYVFPVVEGQTITATAEFTAANGDINLELFKAGSSADEDVLVRRKQEESDNEVVMIPEENSQDRFNETETSDYILRVISARPNGGQAVFNTYRLKVEITGP